MLPKFIVLAACIALASASILPQNGQLFYDERREIDRRGQEGWDQQSRGQQGEQGRGQEWQRGRGEEGQQDRYQRRGQDWDQQRGQDWDQQRSGQDEQGRRQEGQDSQGGLQDILRNLLYVPLTDRNGQVQGYYTSIPNQFLSRLFINGPRDLFLRLQTEGVLPITDLSGQLLGYYSGAIGGSQQQQYDVSSMTSGLYRLGLFPLVSGQGEVEGIYSRYPFVNLGLQSQSSATQVAQSQQQIYIPDYETPPFYNTFLEQGLPTGTSQ